MGTEQDTTSSCDSVSNRTKQTGLCLAVLFLLAGPHAWPLDGGLVDAGACDPAKIRLGLSIFSAVAVLWITEALPVALTALLVPWAAALTGAVPLASSLASFADPLIFLFVGGFALGTALSVHGVDRWCAQRILLWADGRFMRSAMLVFGITSAISMWISNTATTAMVLPLCVGLIGSMGDHVSKDRNARFLLLGTAYAASIGGLGTIVGSPPNGIVARALNLGFAEWLTFGVPTVLLLMPAMVGTLWVILQPKTLLCPCDPSSRMPLPRSGRPVLAVFFVTALLWAAGGWIGPRLGISSGYDTLVSLLATGVLIGGRVISWEQFEKGTPWGVLLLFGGGLALGVVLKDTGASMYLARWVSSLVDGLPLPWVVAVVVLFTIFLTELASNTAVAALLVPVFLAVSIELKVNPALLVVPLGLAASCAFMLPVATGPNALIHATGYVPQRAMVRCGFYLNLVCSVLLTGLAYFYW